MSVDRVHVVGDRASEGRATRVYGTGFIAGSLTRVGAMVGTLGLGIKVSSDKELSDVIRAVIYICIYSR